MREILNKLSNQFPDIKDLLDNDNPEISIILDNKSLYLPRDLDLIVESEIVISPIIAGGACK